MKLKLTMRSLASLILLSACCLFLPSSQAADDAIDDALKELLFAPVRIDAPVHSPAQHTFWFGPFAECATVLDINGDGKLDIAAGRNYYLAPEFKQFANYRDGAEASTSTRPPGSRNTCSDRKTSA